MTTQDKIKEVEKEIRERRNKLKSIDLNGSFMGQISSFNEYIEIVLLEENLKTLKSCSEEITKLKEEQTAKVEKLKENVFGVIDWGKNHGNGELMSKQQIVKIIDKIFSQNHKPENKTKDEASLKQL